MAAVAKLAARRSHNPKVGSSILSCRRCALTNLLVKLQVRACLALAQKLLCGKRLIDVLCIRQLPELLQIRYSLAG